MSNCPPIPAEAMPVVEVLRRDVPRPTTAPLPTGCYVGFRMPGRHAVRCPMGMHPQSTSTCPVTAKGFGDGSVSDDAVALFAYWWDNSATLENAAEALDLIWPQDTKDGER